MSKARRIPLLAAAITAVLLFAFVIFGRSTWDRWHVKVTGGRTVSQAADEYGEPARDRLAPALAAAGLEYPPDKIALLGLKSERSLELWADDGGGWSFVKAYPILAASGKAGPKLREGDRQVPEGVYRISGLNPNSAYHLSMQIDYPNEADLERARTDGRSNLGGEIFIHGSNVSIGCLAMGDEAIEELFVLVSDVGREKVTVLLAPSDPRIAPLSRHAPGAPAWLPELYDEIEAAFEAFPRVRTSASSRQYTAGELV